MRENTDEKNSEYGLFSRSVIHKIVVLFLTVWEQPKSVHMADWEVNFKVQQNVKNKFQLNNSLTL